MLMPQESKKLCVRFKAAVVMLLALALCACASNNKEISVDKNHNFSEIKTFYIQLPVNPINEALQNHLNYKIAQNLTAKGLELSKESDADIVVGYLPTTLTKDDGTTLNLGLGTGSYGRSGGISLGGIFSIPVGEQVSFYQVLDINIMRDGHFIYSASGSIELESKDTISVQAKLDELVDRLLLEYPTN